MRSISVVALTATLVGGCTLERSGLADGASAGAAAAGGLGGGAGGGVAAGGAGAVGGGGAAAGGSGGSPPGVGDCALGEAEECDDCNTRGGDGCDGSGQIEPGWLCPEPGEPCVWIAIETPSAGATSEVGSATAQPPFEEACPPGTLLVGIEATNSGDWPGGGGYLSYVAPRCAAPVVQADLSFEWTTSTLGALHGGVGDCCVQNTTAYPPLACPSDRFAVGFRASESGYLTTMSLLCARMGWDGDGATLDTATIAVGPMGTEVGTDSGDISCPAGTAANALIGSAGAVLDRVGLACATVVASIESGP